MDLKKFRLRDAVEILLDRNQPVFFKTWVLARLMAWMCLDQRHGTRKRNPKTNRPIRFNRERRDAKLAGHLALASILDRRLKSDLIDKNSDLIGKNDDTLRGMVSLFVKSGSFGLFLKSPRGARGWLSRMRRSTQELFYVRQIVEYLCRGVQSHVDEKKRTIECAKIFVENTDRKLTKRTLGKYWEDNKQAAPYTFAFYEFLVSTVNQAVSIDQFVDTLEQLAKDQKRLDQLLGHAAYAADIVANQARKVRVRDFMEVKREPPQLPTFTEDEIQIISAIDPKYDPKDPEDFKPIPVKKQSAPRKRPFVRPRI